MWSAWTRQCTREHDGAAQEFCRPADPAQSPLLTEQAGYEFAAQGEVTAEPRTQLDAPLMSAAEYVQFLGM